MDSGSCKSSQSARMNFATGAPSIARWSNTRPAGSTVLMAIAPSTTNGLSTKEPGWKLMTCGRFNRGVETIHVPGDMKPSVLDIVIVAPLVSSGASRPSRALPTIWRMSSLISTTPFPPTSRTTGTIKLEFELVAPRQRDRDADVDILPNDNLVPFDGRIADRYPAAGDGKRLGVDRRERDAATQFVLPREEALAPRGEARHVDLEEAERLRRVG